VCYAKVTGCTYVSAERARAAAYARRQGPKSRERRASEMARAPYLYGRSVPMRQWPKSNRILPLAGYSAAAGRALGATPAEVISRPRGHGPGVRTAGSTALVRPRAAPHGGGFRCPRGITSRHGRGASETLRGPFVHWLTTSSNRGLVRISSRAAESGPVVRRLLAGGTQGRFLCCWR
jgi:hypothetical protein